MRTRISNLLSYNGYNCDEAIIESIEDYILRKSVKHNRVIDGVSDDLLWGVMLGRVCDLANKGVLFKAPYPSNMEDMVRFRRILLGHGITRPHNFYMLHHACKITMDKESDLSEYSDEDLWDILGNHIQGSVYYPLD